MLNLDYRINIELQTSHAKCLILGPHFILNRFGYLTRSVKFRRWPCSRPTPDPVHEFRIRFRSRRVQGDIRNRGTCWRRDSSGNGIEVEFKFALIR
jgi:hypothetical protein